MSTQIVEVTSYELDTEHINSCYEEYIMGAMSIWHWLILLLVVALVFGTSKLKNIGKDLGGAVKGFKEGMKEASEAANEIKSTEKADVENK